MGRKRSTVGDDVIDIVSWMPWWVGIALAVLSYLLLHALAKPPPAMALQPAQMSAYLTSAMISSLASIGQLIVPFLCLIGSGASFVRRRKREQLLGDAVRANSADAISSLSWREFEMLVGEAFRLQGYEVHELGGNGPDGGVDLVLRKGTETHLVQCKQWKAFKVGVAVVRELYGVMAARGAAGGFVITSGTFTDDAKAFADGRNVKLIDGPKLLALIQQAKTAKGSVLPQRPIPTAGAKASVGGPPACPSCQSPMVRRTAKKGVNAGSEFWGCSRYPACRGAR